MLEGTEELLYFSYGVSALVNVVFAILWIAVGIRCAMTPKKAPAGLFIAGGCLALLTIAVSFVGPLVTSRIGTTEDFVTYNVITSLGTTTLFAIQSTLVVAGVFGLMAKKERT